MNRYFLAEYKTNNSNPPIQFLIENPTFDKDGLECDRYTTNVTDWIEGGRWVFHQLAKLELVVGKLPDWAEKKKYYKVVDQHRDKITSSRYGSLEYKVGEWTAAPENTRLFVFDNLDEAKWFRHYDESVYLCEVEEPVKQAGAEYETDIWRFWQIFNRNGKVTHSDMRLSTTVGILAKRVKLIEKVV